MWRMLLILTCSLDKAGVVLSCKEWIGKFAEELFQESSYTVHIVHEIFGVAEVNLRGVYRWLALNRNESFLYNLPLSNIALILLM